MLSKLTLTDLDNLRAEAMMALLNAKGRKEIWKYDIMPRKAALIAAIDRDDFDAEMAGQVADGKPFCLAGPGIVDTYFGTVAELVGIVYWLCGSYLSEHLVKPGDTYANQQEFINEAAQHSFSFLPLPEAK